jgi:putative oligomerization/nucleic acid binding protein/phospholipase D-like protein
VVVLSLGEFLWSLLAILFMVSYFMILFHVIVDVFQRQDASGGKKALWLIALLVIPLFAMIVYMIMNTTGMEERSVRGPVAGAGRYDDPRVNSAGSASEIAKAKDLLDAGTINQDEFNRMKAQALAG